MEHPPKTTRSNRLPAIDAFKAIAAQLIVLHHLAAYGPISDAVQKAAPDLISWLYDYARMAVQVFLVIGGYLAARTMFTSDRDEGSYTGAIFNRYLRLTLPFMAAVVLSIVCAMLARQWMADDFIPDAPTWRQLLAHTLLLQSVLDVDALSAGAWYIAIDFQLFLLMLGIVWLGNKTASARSATQALTTLMAAASLFWFNRDTQMDAWAPYFFGSYGLGAAAYWAGHRGSGSRFWLALIVSLSFIALIIDFRARIALAVGVALILYLARDSKHIEQYAARPVPQHLSKISYSLFLVHFPILMLANLLFNELGYTSALAGTVGMLATWGISLYAAGVFYRWIEKPASSFKFDRFRAFWKTERLVPLRYQLATTMFWVLAIPV